MNNKINVIEQLNLIKEDEKFIKFQEKIINTRLNIIGVKVPKIRKLAKDIFRNKTVVEFDENTDKYFESVFLEGLLISFEKDKLKLKEMLNKFYEKMDNWAVVDMLCSSLVSFKKDVDEADFNYFCELASSEKEFVSRFGIVALMKYFLNEKYLEGIFSALKKVKCEKYYVDMAIAWLMSEIIIKNTQNVDKIVKKVLLINNFNRFIVNKCIQKVCDSYRVSQNIKDKLKELRSK